MITIPSKKRSLILVILFLLPLISLCREGNGKVNPVVKEKQTPVSTIKWKINLQPYKNSTLLINGIKQTPKILSKDKTLATMILQVPRYRDGSGFEFIVENPGFQTLKRNISLDREESRYKKEIPLFMLDKAGSTHRYVNYYYTGEQPKSVTFIDNQRVVMPLLSGNGADIINVVTGERGLISPPAKWAKKKGFVESLVIRKHNELWISQMYTNSIHIFALDTLKYLTTIKVSGSWGKVLCYDNHRDRVYFSNWVGKNLSVIDIKTRKELSRISIHGIPRGMLVSPDGKYLYVAQYGIKNDGDRQGHVLKISLGSNKIVKTMGRPGAKRHIVSSAKGGIIYVSDMGRSSVDTYHLDNDRQGKTIPVYSHPNTIALSPDEKYLYVSCRGKNNPKSYLIKGFDMGRIYVIDTSRNEVVEYWEGGNQPTGLDVSPDGKYMVSSDFLDKTIRVYERVTP